MKITWKHGYRSIEFEHTSMPPERFTALCKLAGAVIGSLVLVALLRMVGIWAVAWAVGAMVLTGRGRIFGGLMK